MIVNRDELLDLRQQWRAAGKKVIFTNGCFDLIHVGHVSYLQKARALGDVLIVGLNSDTSVRQLKGVQRPLVTQADRALVMDALKPVDYVTIFEEATATAIITALQPNFYVKGGDYSLVEGASVTQKPLPEAPAVLAYGGQIVLIPFLPGHSTTELIHKVLQAYALKSS